MKERFTCHFCETTFPLTYASFSSRRASFEKEDWFSQRPIPKSALIVNFYNCPHCEKISVSVIGCGDQFPEKKMLFFPDSLAKQFPEYIPKQIRDDYEEAYKIVGLSPKASATLSRRCLQGMLRDVFNATKKNLATAIDEVKEKIMKDTPDVFAALSALREMGNIGAHMEKDIDLIIEIDPGEAERLLQLVEMLIHDWYVVPHKRKELINKIIATNDEKQALRLTGDISHPNK